MKEIAEIDTPMKFGCEFCKREFARESTVLKHICEYKHRWIERDKQGNRIGFQAWLQFYQKNSASKKNKTYEEFIKSAYYTAFVKFGSYCVNINAINISRFADWLLKNQVKIDGWCSDTVYTKYLIEYLRHEDALDAIHRSVETTISMAVDAGIKPNHLLSYGNTNKICYAIATGKISPWMLYQSDSGVKFLETLNPDHARMIMDYINPEQWALKFHREPEHVRTVKEILKAGGY
jgi:hypothetical protein